MAKYKINVIAVLLKNGGLAKHGELIDEEQLARDADQLVKGGYISRPSKEEIEDWKKLNEPDEKNKAKAEEEESKKKAADEARKKAEELANQGNGGSAAPAAPAGGKGAKK
jgi:hypothetical protein